MQIENAPSARTHRHVFHAARSFDNEGLLVFDPGRYSVSRSVCFVEPAPEPAPTPTPAPEPTFTKAEFDAQMARARKSFEAESAKAIEKATATTRAELEALKQAQEDAGKSAAEREKLALERERNAWLQKTEAEKARADANEAAAQKASLELRDTRINYELNATFAAAKVLPEATRAALLVFRADAEIEHDAETGKVTAVTVAEKRFGTLGEAVAEWMKTNGAIYVAAPQGGAGSRQGNAGAGNKPAYLRTTEENLALANEQRARGR